VLFAYVFVMLRSTEVDFTVVVPLIIVTVVCWFTVVKLPLLVVVVDPGGTTVIVVVVNPLLVTHVYIVVVPADTVVEEEVVLGVADEDMLEVEREVDMDEEDGKVEDVMPAANTLGATRVMKPMVSMAMARALTLNLVDRDPPPPPRRCLLPKLNQLPLLLS
jgi:hypothetical protein